MVGKSREATTPCQELIIEMAENIGQKREFNLHFRAYDDGIAFRYDQRTTPHMDSETRGPDQDITINATRAGGTALMFTPML